MGAPIDKFIVGNNDNHPFVEYLNTGDYKPRASVPTLSNAMDIGKPNNFPRIFALHDGKHKDITNICYGARFNDAETERHMRKIYKQSGYLMCPHTAVGHLAMDEFTQNQKTQYTKITVSTAHAAKFKEDVERVLRAKIAVPKALQACIDAPSHKHTMSPTIEALSDYLDASQ